MSRIPPIALRIACNTRNYDCSGISSYYYTNQLLANFVLIQNVKSLGQQLVFPMNDLKPNDPKLAIQPSLFPVHTILKTHRTWQSKLKNHKSFFNSKTIPFACTFVFDHLNHAISSPSYLKSASSEIQSKAHQKIDSNLGPFANALRLNHIWKKTEILTLLISSEFNPVSSFTAQKAARLNTTQKPLWGRAKFEYSAPQTGASFVGKHGCLNLLRLKQIMAMKKFRPTHEIKHDIFYLACTGLIQQGQRLPSPMLAKKQFASGIDKMQANNFNPKATLYKPLYFESVARDSEPGKVNRNVSDLRQTIHRALGIPKCFISRSCDQNAQLHLWHILPYDYAASGDQLTLSLTNPGHQNCIQPIATYKKGMVTFGPKHNSKVHRINHDKSMQVNDVRGLLILFHMYDCEQNGHEAKAHGLNRKHSNMHSACVRF